MARKKPQKKQEEGVAAWLGTYGDMITLVLTFFILLYSFSSIDALKWERLVSSFTGTPFIAVQALDPNRAGPLSRMSEETEEQKEAEKEDIEKEDDEEKKDPKTDDSAANVVDVKEKFDELFHKIATHIKDNGLDMKLNVEKEEDFIILHITDSTLFNSGKAYIKPEARIMLGNVSNIFVEYDSIIKMIRIEGHTDNRQIHTAQYESNWELSIDRAVNVLRYFLDGSKIEDGKFSAVGYGEYHPIADNDTREGRSQNRRVDFLIESINKTD